MGAAMSHSKADRSGENETKPARERVPVPEVVPLPVEAIVPEPAIKSRHTTQITLVGIGKEKGAARLHEVAARVSEGRVSMLGSSGPSAFGKTARGLTGQGDGCYYLPANRLEWFDCWPDVRDGSNVRARTGPVSDTVMPDEQVYHCEYSPILAT